MKHGERARRPTPEQRRDHLQTLELLAGLIAQLQPPPAVNRQFVLFAYDEG